jgi:AraC-like DNA-binding protein
MGGLEDAEPVELVSIIDPLPWTRMPMARLGGGGASTEVICGYLATDAPLFDPRLQALPLLFVVSPPAGPARLWVNASIEYALQQTSPAADGGLTGPTHLPELLVREVLRLHLSSAPSIDRGWLAALSDPVLSPALAAIHSAPDLKWTVAELARRAHVSVSLLDERFRESLQLAPIRYLTQWRMHVARDLLSSTTLGVGAIARKVGYDSEEAFSRAFKRHHGSPPSATRRPALTENQSRIETRSPAR